MSDHDDDDPAPSSPRRALIGLAVIVVAIAGVLFVMYKINQSAKMQDCLASGRTNCAQIETPVR
jgi:hypothetical protein